MTKSRMKLLTGIVGVVTAVALVGGGTMAWFTDKKEVAGSKFTAGTVEIQAGQSVVEDTGSSGKVYYKIIELDPTAISALQGTKMNGGRIDADRGNPKKVLASDKEMFSLGYGNQSTTGVLTARFTEALGKGDVLVIENTWGGTKPDPKYVETAKVYVSADNDEWTYAGTITNQVSGGDQRQNLVPSPIPDALYIKIVDTTPKTLSSGETNKSEDGFDIDYIAGRSILDEANWNPGDINKLAFYVTNSGTKDIDVRVKLEGHWETLQGGEWKKNDSLTNDVIDTVVTNNKSWTKKGDFYYCSSNDKSGLKGVNGGESPSATDTIAVLDLEVTLSGDAGNEYQNAKYVITPTFQAIQHSHSDGWSWDNFDTYNGTSED
ncbi:MAG: TasA family protein [bacterium]